MAFSALSRESFALRYECHDGLTEMSVVSKTPLTVLQSASTGGAPVFIGGDRLTSDSAVPTAPAFADDSDPYLSIDPRRRGLVTIAHIPAAGSANIDFVTLHLRNAHVTQRAYVNVLFAADLSVQLRVDGLPSASPVYGDILLAETDGTASSAICEIDAGTNALRVSVVASDVFDIAPTIVLNPVPSGLVSAIAVMGADGRVAAVSIIEATSHAYSSPPAVKFVGGIYRRLGCFVSEDEDTLVYEHNTAGTVSVVSTLCRTQYASNVSAPGDVVIFGNEARVVRYVSSNHQEFGLDRALLSSTTSFSAWSYIPLATASSASLLRTGVGLLAVNAVYGSNAGLTTQPHQLAVGDIVFYTAPATGLDHSHRVTTVVDAASFLVDSSFGLTAGETVEWRFIYLLSQANPEVSTSTLASTTRVVSVLRVPADDSGDVIDVLGLGGRKLWLQNKTFFGTPGSYYTVDAGADAAVAVYGTLAPYHLLNRETPNVISPRNVIEIVVPPQPAPATAVLSGAALSGGLVGGKRPIIAVYQRGTRVRSRTVTMWGDYQRYSPNAISTYLQGINV